MVRDPSFENRMVKVIYELFSLLYQYFSGWLTGIQLKFDCKESKLKSNNLALGYSTHDFVLHTSV